MTVQPVRTRILDRSLLAVPVLLLAAMAWSRRWVCDDAFIDFRVVQNCLAGHGPIFNLGERVEAYSNPAWVGMLVVAGRLGLPLEPTAVVLGGLLAVGGMLAMLAAARNCGPRTLQSWWTTPDAASGAVPDVSPRATAVVGVPLGALAVASLAPVWDFSTSGLEMGLVFAWLGVTFWAVSRLALRTTPTTRFAVRAAALCCGLGPLVRPDLAVFSIAFLTVLLVCRRRDVDPPWIEIVAWAACLPVGYQVFRMGYFAAIVSNSTLAKEPGLARWDRGWLYAREFMRVHEAILPLALLLGVWACGLRHALRKRDRNAVVVLAAPTVAACLHALAVVRAGGDFMFARLLLPSVWGGALAVATVPLPTRPRSRPEIFAWIVAGGILAWCAVDTVALHTRYPGGHGPYELADERGFYVHEARTPHPIRSRDFAPTFFARDGNGLRVVADSLAAMAATGIHERLLILSGASAPDHGREPPRQWILGPATPWTTVLVVARRNIGLTGFIAGPRVVLVDRFGLADPLASRLQVVTRGRPGHEKWLPDAWIVARFAATDSLRDDERQARQALAGATLSELQRAVTDPLDGRRFRANLGAAFRLSKLRIPADPAVAVRELGNP